MTYKTVSVLAFLAIFLIPFANAVVSHGANQVFFSDSESLQSKFTSGALGKWQGTTDIYYNGGNVGIGTASPAAKLDVDGDTAISNGYLTVTRSSVGNNAALNVRQTGTGLIAEFGTPTNNNLVNIDANGNVGIGTSAPGAKLEVAGQIKITGGSPGIGKVLTSDANGLAMWQTLSSGGWTINGNNMYSAVTGNVGIGTTNPGQKLEVAGSIKAKELIDSDDSAYYVNPSGDSLFSGSIGIGTTAPQKKLHVVGNAGIIRIEGSTHAYMEYYPWGSTTRGAYTGFPSSGSIDFNIGNEAYEGDIILTPGDSAGPGSPVGSVKIERGSLYLPKSASSPFACTSTTKGAMYFDTSAGYNSACTCIHDDFVNDWIWASTQREAGTGVVHILQCN
ncbi:MAG: hypothetical protein KKD18_02370 [Nanoarchaeota archaeon]|nr:hypothetical protein [Nanoarchaeota archaeon]MBU0977236.1 hypothetical protein [Nanoarchaeota archaeon]